MIVKVCGLTNAEDAAFAAAEGADLLGFVSHPPSPRHCADVASAAAGLEDRAVLVAVGDQAEPMLRALESAGLRRIQPHVPLEHRAEVIQRLKKEGCYLLLPWNEEEGQGILPADLYLWEGNPRESGVEGGSGRVHAMAFPPPGPFLLAGGLDAGNLQEQVRRMPTSARSFFEGFDAASRLESSPGHKDPAKVRAFIRAAKTPT